MTVVLPGELGKPRPALLVQSDQFGMTTPIVTVLPFTGTYPDAPLLRIEASRGQNALIKQSDVQIDKATSHAAQSGR